MIAAVSGVRIPDFAGVALVDILANGVATLVIIIAISISARFEQESEVLEQVAETTVVLSREFSDKLVINKLSGNAPARLHDYERSPLDQYLDVRVMPIFELHEDFVRDFFSGRTYARSELLLRETAMDERLRSFNPVQRRRIRIDIYDVHQFYVFMSILRAHDIRISHWHFLGGGGIGYDLANRCPPGVSAADCQSAFAARNGDAKGNTRGGEDDLDLTRKLDDLMASAAGEEPGAGAGGAEQGAERTGRGTRSSDDAATDALFNALAGVNEEHTRAGPHGARTQLPPGNVDTEGLRSAPDAGRYGGERTPSLDRGPRSRKMGSSADRWHTSVLRGMGQASGGSAQADGSRPVRMRMHLATPDAQMEHGAEGSGRSSPMQELVHSGTANTGLHQILAAWLDYLADIQEQLDDNVSPWGLMSRFKDELKARLGSVDSISDEERALLDPLVQAFNEYWPDDTPPRVEWMRSEHVSGMAVEVPVNATVESVRVLADELQYLPDAAYRPRHLTLNINMHPSPYKGMHKELKSYGVLLMPPGQADREQYKWRALAHISPAFDDFSLGFVYAALSPDGSLLLDPEGNNIQIDAGNLRIVRSEPRLSVHGWMTLFYSALALGILLLLPFWHSARLWLAARFAPARYSSDSA